LNIVHVVRQFSPSVGGLESAVLSLAQRQADDFGMAPRIVTLDRLFGPNIKLPANDEVGGIPVSRLPWRGSSRYPLAPAVFAQLRGADIVHVHGIDFFFDFLALTSPLHGRRLVASTHGGFFHTAKFAGLKELWFNSVTKISASAYRQIAACSQSDFDLFKTHAPGRLRLIENGIDINKFAAASSAAQTRTIIYFGRFAEHKRVAALFPIIAALRKLHPSWRLIVAGSESGQTIRDLTSMAEQQGAAGAVTFEASPSDDRLRTLIGKASFFGCLSSYEGFGLAAVEAMSAGLVPVLSGIAPFLRLRDIAPDVLIAEPGDAAAIPTALEAAILTGPENGARKCRIIDAVSRYDWRHVARQYAQLYNEVLGKRPQPVPADLGSRV
jgi:alpha-1,3-mannosyltransferase